MTKTVKWARYRTKHASGPGEWEWVEVAVIPGREDEALEYEAAELESQLSTHSEHWRGIEIEWAVSAAAVVTRAILLAEARIMHLHADIRRWKAQRNRLQNTEGKYYDV